MKLIVDKVVNEYRTSLTWRLDSTNSQYCCEKLKDSNEAFDIRTYTDLPQPILRIKAGNDYYDGEYTKEAEVDYCPFCGTKIIIEIRKLMKLQQFKCKECNCIIVEGDLDNHRIQHIRQQVESSMKVLEFIPV